MAYQEDPGIEGAPEWITTFVDMISLLVTFFILLFTFSSIDKFDVFKVPKNLIGSRGILESRGGDTATNPPSYDIMSAMDVARGSRIPHVRPQDRLAENLEEMGQKLTAEHLEFDLSAVLDGIVIQFGVAAAFRPGSTGVSPTLRKALVELGRTMENYPNRIVIEGFTDSEFKPTARYPSAEALSCARAMAAAEAMLEGSGLPSELVQIAGLGPARPLNANRTASARTANRRVEIRILSLDRRRADRAQGPK